MQPDRPRRSIHATLLVNHAPVLIFAVVILAVSALLVYWLMRSTGALAAGLDGGTTTASDVRGLGRTLVGVWLGCLALFLMSGAVALPLSLRAARGLTESLHAVASHAQAIADGDPGPSLPVRSADALGALEAALNELRTRVLAREDELREVGAARAFEGQLHRGLEMARDEPRVLAVVARALDSALPGQPAHLMLADSSRAHLRRVAASKAGSDLPTCGVESPAACPAAASGQTRVFSDATALDACPCLATASARRWAACTPVAIAGRTVGVLSAHGPDGSSETPGLVAMLEGISGHVGNRLAVLRALAGSELAAAMDPLTGLLNRRALGDRFRGQVGTVRPYVVIMSDLDHFKRLNDTHGHETGDRVLRVYAQALRDGVRRDDLVSRHGGEEFVLVLPDCPVEEAARIAGALRAGLPARAAGANVPLFSGSYGIAASPAGTPLEDTLRRADAALYEAKQAGRNCAVVAGQGVVDAEGPATASVPALAIAAPPSRSARVEAGGPAA